MYSQRIDFVFVFPIVFPTAVERPWHLSVQRWLASLKEGLLRETSRWLYIQALWYNFVAKLCEILCKRPFRTNFDLWVFTVFLSNLVYWVGFGAVMAIKTHWRNAECIDFPILLVFESVLIYIYIYIYMCIRTWKFDTRGIDIWGSGYRYPIPKAWRSDFRGRDPIFKA